MPFPNIARAGQGKIDRGFITYHFLNSFSQPVERIAYLLEPEEIVAKTKARHNRFHSTGPGSRESESSRGERKLISAHPMRTLHEAYELMDEPTRMEFNMMLDEKSHYGNSDPIWMKTHAMFRNRIVGDDKQPLNGQLPLPFPQAGGLENESDTY